MPLKFVRAERAIAKKIKSGDIPKYYYRHGKRIKSSPFALARHATGFYGPTRHKGKTKSTRKMKYINI